MQRWYSRFLPRSAWSLAWLAILIVFAISFLALVGWVLDITLLKSVKPQWIRMSPITATCLFFSAMELALLQLSPSNLRRFIVLQAPAMLVLIVSLLTIVLYLIAMITGQEPFLAEARVFNPFWAPASRIALLTAILFLLSGCSLVLLSIGSLRTANIAHALMLPGAMLSYLVLVSYLLGVQAMHGWLDVPVALNTGIAFCALSLAIFCVRPDTWLMSVLTDGHAGGVMARRLLPVLLIIPFLIGWLHLYLERAGALVAEINVALAAIAGTFFLLCIVWLTAASLNRADSERRQAQEALQSSEEKFRLAFENANIGMALVGIDGRYLQVNNALSGMFGYNREELEKMGVRDLTYPDDLQSSRDFWLRTVRGEIGSAQFEKRKVHSNGTIVWVHIASSLVRDSQGKPLYFVSQVQDITARKQAEEELRRVLGELEQRVKDRTVELRQAVAQLQEEVTERQRAEDLLRESEKRFSAFMQNLPGTAVMRDLQGRYIYTNETLEKITGKGHNEFLGKTLGEIWAPEVAEWLKQLDGQVIRDKEAMQTIEEMEQEDGRHSWLIHRFPIMDGAGQPAMVGGIGVDITARQKGEEALRKSEQRLRLLTSQILTAQEKERKRISMELHEGLGQSLATLKLDLRFIQKHLTSTPVKLKEDFEDVQTHLKEMVEDIRRIPRDLSPVILENLGLVAALKYLFDELTKYQEVMVSSEMDDIDNLFSLQTKTNIYRVLQEIFNNIAKHAQATIVSVSIKKQDGSVIFCIKDNVVGFDLGQITHKEMADKGIGFTAIDERLRMIGSYPNIVSQTGMGTEISFSIPIDAK